MRVRLRVGPPRTALLLSGLLALSGTALGQAGTPQPATPEGPKPPAVVDSLDDEAPAAVPSTDAGPPVDSGEGTTFDEELDAGVLQVEPLPEPDALEQPELPPQEAPVRPIKVQRTADGLPFELPKVPTFEVPTEQELAAHIEARAAALRAGDTTSADLELALLEELRLGLAARNVIVVSAQLIQEAKVAMELGQLDLAIMRADAAARLSPDLEAAHWLRARLQWRKDKTALPVIGSALQSLVAARFTAFRNQVSFLTLLLTVLGMGLLATVVCFTALQLLKYVRYPAHDLSEKVPEFIGGGELVILLFVLVLLPFGLGLGVAPTLAIALAAVAGYQQDQERWVSWGLMAVLALGPLVLYAAAPLVSFHGSVVDAMAEATSEAFAEQAEVRLQRAEVGRGDYAAAMVLAHRMRQRGDVIGASAAYQRAAKAQPNDPVVQNNLGVTLLAQGKSEAAEAAFRAAMAAGGGAEPYLNLALMMADRGIFDQSSGYMEKARARDPGMVAQHTLMSGAASKKAAVAPFDDGLLWERLFATGRLEADAITVQLWRPMSGRLSPLVTSLVVILISALGALVAKRSRNLCTACPRCGLPATRGAQGDLCAQCTSVFLSASSAVQPKLQERKVRSVSNYQLRRRWGERLLSVVAGAGHLMGGRPTLGLALFFPFAVLTLGMAFGEQAAVHPWYVYVDESGYTAKLILACIALAVLSLISLKSSFEK